MITSVQTDDSTKMLKGVLSSSYMISSILSFNRMETPNVPGMLISSQMITEMLSSDWMMLFFGVVIWLDDINIWCCHLAG
jgi:hypothetical protein